MSTFNEVLAAYLSRNEVEPKDLPNVVKQLRDAMGVDASVISDVEKGTAPAVPIEKSLTDDYLICLEDGVKLKTLKRHLWTKYRMTPEQYRRRWGLPSSYPMTAPAYSRLRSGLATDNKEFSQGGRKAQS